MEADNGQASRSMAQCANHTQRSLCIANQSHSTLSKWVTESHEKVLHNLKIILVGDLSCQPCIYKFFYPPSLPGKTEGAVQISLLRFCNHLYLRTQLAYFYLLSFLLCQIAYQFGCYYDHSANEIYRVLPPFHRQVQIYTFINIYFLQKKEGMYIIPQAKIKFIVLSEIWSLPCTSPEMHK